MPWPVTINGTVYTENDFAPFRYPDTFPRFAADLEATARQAEAAKAQAATIAAAFLAQRYGTVLITAATALSMAAHGNRLLQVSGSATLSLAWADTGGGFSCLIVNGRSVALPLTLTGTTLSNPDGHTKIRAGGMAALVATEGAPGVIQLTGQTE